MNEDPVQSQNWDESGGSACPSKITPAAPLHTGRGPEPRISWTPNLLISQ